MDKFYNFNVHLDDNAKTASSPEKKTATGADFIKSVLVPADKQIEYIVHINKFVPLLL